MNQDTAERWVVLSALVVAGVYVYRRLTEPAAPPPTLKKLAGIGGLAPVGSFATAWGFTYMTLAIVTEVSPGLGGSFAVLIMAGELLTNGADVFADVGTLQAPAAKPAPAPAPSSAPLAATIVGAG